MWSCCGKTICLWSADTGAWLGKIAGNAGNRDLDEDLIPATRSSITPALGQPRDNDHSPSGSFSDGHVRINSDEVPPPPPPSPVAVLTLGRRCEVVPFSTAVLRSRWPSKGFAASLSSFRSHVLRRLRWLQLHHLFQAIPRLTRCTFSACRLAFLISAARQGVQLTSIRK